MSTSALSITTDTDMINFKQTSGSNPLRMKSGKATMEKIDQTAGEFESQFVSQMFSTIFGANETDEEDAVGNGSDAEQVYNSMLNNEYGKLIARTGGVGVAEQVKRVMLKQQEVE